MTNAVPEGESTGKNVDAVIDEPADLSSAKERKSGKDTASQRRYKTLALGLIPVVVLGGLLSMDSIPGTNISLTVPYAAEGPGPTVDTLSQVDGTDVVEVVADDVDTPEGQLNMTTVSVTTNMTLGQVLYKWLSTDDTIVPLSNYMRPDTTMEEVEEANKQAFVQSESAATYTAMEYLGVPVKTVVAEVLKDSPARTVLERGDVITEVNGTPAAEPAEIQRLIQSQAPGDELTLKIERAEQVREEKLTLGERPEDDSLAFLGVTMLAEPDTDIEVNYNLQDIGGPSAGMMFTLAVIDKLSPGDLSGGNFVAGTGTIGLDGQVGPIGGIKHKVRASMDAGAELFLAPADNCQEATSRDHGDMVIASVRTIDDAIKAMEDFAAGKEVTTCPAS